MEKKIITAVCEDLFLFMKKELAIPEERIHTEVFRDIPKVTFTVASFTYTPGDPWGKHFSMYKEWKEAPRQDFPLQSVLDLANKKEKNTPAFFHLMLGQKDVTTQCSLHCDEIPRPKRLKNSVRPPIIAVVNAGKRTKQNMFRPFLEYREYSHKKAAFSLVDIFSRKYRELAYSEEYSHETIDLDEMNDTLSEFYFPKSPFFEEKEKKFNFQNPA